MLEEFWDERKHRNAVSFRGEEIEIHIKFLIRVPDGDVHGPTCNAAHSNRSKFQFQPGEKSTSSPR